jgi:hypothetical protein
METHYIEYKSKKYPIIEPTIELWQKLTGLQNWTDETEFAVMMISHITGLDKEEILQADWQQIIAASQNITNHLLLEGKQFHREFEFDGVKYRFIDLPNLTFGEFVDIDTFLSKPEAERKRELNLLMALLYREVGKDGKLETYDGNKVQIRADKFRKLPVKFVNGASTFFLRIERILHKSSRLSSRKRLKMRLKVIWTLVKLLTSKSFGVGLVRLLHWPKMILPKWKK